jgi:hypothetical protein
LLNSRVLTRQDKEEYDQKLNDKEIIRGYISQMNPRKKQQNKQPMQNSIKKPVRQSNNIGGSNSDSFINHSTYDNNNRNSNEYQDDNVLTMQATGNEKGFPRKMGSTVIDD